MIKILCDFGWTLEFTQDKVGVAGIKAKHMNETTRYRIRNMAEHTILNPRKHFYFAVTSSPPLPDNG